MSSKGKEMVQGNGARKGMFMLVAAAVLSVIALQNATGQEAQALEEIIVTATKRAERLQDVPISISVVTADDIDRRGLVSAEDYLRGIPGVNQTTQPFGQTITIRGIETNPAFQNGGAGTTTATYFGETPTTNTQGIAGFTNVDVKLVDIERVEVLRGPQGTAFGNSSLGGAVRTIPVAPKLDRADGQVAASYSSTAGTGGDNHHFEAVGNLPLLKDKLALRATAYRYRDTGFYRNVAGSDPTVQSAAAAWGAQAFAINRDHVGTSRFFGGRVAALFQASDALRVTLTYLTQKTEMDGRAAATTDTYEQAFLQVAPENALRGQTDGLNDTHIDLANAVLEYDLGWANLLASFSHTRSGADRSTYLLQAWSQHSVGEHRENVGEIRLTTQLDGAWNFLGGVYAEELKDDQAAANYWYGSPESNLFGPVGRVLGNNSTRANLKQKAAFAEASWEFLPSVTLTGGVRAYDYERTGRVFRIGPQFGAASGTVTNIGADASGTSFRGNLSHKLNDNALVYVGWSQGFRLGNPQVGLPDGVCDRNSDGLIDGTDNVTIESTRFVNSDGVDNYELGGKFTLLDRRLTIAADVYRIEWSGLPVVVQAPGTIGSIDGSGCGIGYLANAGAARSEGIEFQANFYVTEAFRVDVGGSYVRARLTKDAPAINAFEGDRLPNSPKVNGSLGLQYEFTIGGSEAFVRLDSIYIGPFYGAVQAPAAGSIPAGDYVKVDALVRVAIRNTNIDLFVRNLMNADEFTFRNNINPGAVDEFSGFRLRPRTVGVQLSYNF